MKSALAPDPPLTRGHKKKSRTRQRLLEAALEVLAERGEGFSIDEVAQRAGVSHGTFYNYFADREALQTALVAHAVEEFAAVSAREVQEPDPAMRFARISARAITTAIASPTAVRFTLRLEAAQRAVLVDGPLAYMRGDLEEGHRAGRFAEAPDDAVIDLIVGTLLLAARRVIAGESNPDYPVAVIRRLLMALGVDGNEASHMAQQAVANT